MERRNQPDLPSFEEMGSDLEDSKLTIAVEGDGWRALLHPDLEGEQYGAPFPFRVVGDHPPKSDIAVKLSNKYDDHIDQVYTMIAESDNPVEAIMDMEPEDLIVVPDDS